MYDHLKETRKNTENFKKWYEIRQIKKQGKEPIIKIYKDNMSEKEAYALEEKLIMEYGRRDIDENGILTNITLGGNNPPITKMFGSDNPMYKKKYTEEEKKKISERMRGNKNPFYGKTHSEKFKKHMRENNPSFSKTPEEKQKSSIKRQETMMKKYGKKSISIRGLTPWNKGKKLPHLSGEGSSVAKKIKIGNHEFSSITDASKKTKFSKDMIRNYINGILPKKGNNAKKFINMIKESQTDPECQ